MAAQYELIGPFTAVGLEEELNGPELDGVEVMGISSVTARGERGSAIVHFVLIRREPSP